MSVSIRKISNALGAEVVGVNLSTSVDERLIETIKSALHEHLLLVIRDQNLMPGAQVEFSKRFGNLVVRVSGEFLHPQHNETIVYQPYLYPMAYRNSQNLLKSSQ